MSDIWAEDINYWKTSRTAPDTWMGKAVSEIEKANGVVTSQAFAMDIISGEVFMLKFRFGDDCFHVFWPVLESKTGDIRAARRQSATMLYHDIKSKCISAKILGVRRAFVAFLVLTNGITADEIAKSSDISVPLLIEGS
jgi:hypothetical protein